MKTSTKWVAAAVLLACVGGAGVLANKRPRDSATPPLAGPAQPAAVSRPTTAASSSAARATDSSPPRDSAPATWFKLSSVEKARHGENDTSFAARTAGVARYRAFATAAKLTAEQDALVLAALARLQLDYENFERAQRNFVLETSADPDRAKITAQLRETQLHALADMNSEAQDALSVVLDSEQLKILDIHFGLATLHVFTMARPFELDVSDGAKVEPMKMKDDPAYLERLRITR